MVLVVLVVHVVLVVVADVYFVEIDHEQIRKVKRKDKQIDYCGDGIGKDKDESMIKFCFQMWCWL